MFATTSGAPSTTAVRNPRRRQRTGSDDSVAARQLPKRLKRSGLTSQTFKPIQNTSAHGDPYSRDVTPSINGYYQDLRKHSPEDRESVNLTIRNRGAKRPERDKRTPKGDGSVELTKNETYSVTRLATTPGQFQTHQSSLRWHGNLAPGMGYAVAITPTEALVWRYKHGKNPMDSSKPLVVRLLHAASNANQPLPLALLVPSSPEPGLLIVTPVCGKATYWETLSSAASVDLSRQKQQAIQGTITGLASGERVTKMIEAEPQGFLLTISSGKIVHLSIADAQGKASISTQILRNTNTQTGGIFGSLRNVFGGSGWPRDIAAVKAATSFQRGQRECIVGTTRGVLQAWELNWNGAHSLKYEVDARPKLLESIRDIGIVPPDSEDQLFGVLDFAFLSTTTTGRELASSRSKSETSLLVLTVASQGNNVRYNLHVVNIANGAVDVPVVHPISCYRTPAFPEAAFKPTLLVSEQGQTAYVVFEKSLVLVSLEEIPDSPDSQLQTETSKMPDPFQDVLDFRGDKGYLVVGCGMDTPDRGFDGSACTVMVQGYGVIRVSVAPLAEGLTLLDRATITAEAKLGQAVFYGSQQSLFDFSGRPEIQFATEEVEEAAIRISRSITSSSSKHLSTAGPSMEQHLQRRATALADLIKHLRKHYQPIHLKFRWELLWEAEKMAAARAIWRCYSNTFASKPKEEKVLLYELVECISEKDKTENQPDDHETDRVRHWLIHDVWRLEILLPWATKALTLLYNESVEDNAPMTPACRARLISEAHDIQLAALETAYSFRQDNASLYGLDENTMVNGVLSQGYEGMPEIWTSTGYICQAVQQLAEYFQEFATDLDSHNSSDEEGSSPPQQLLEKIAQSNSRLVDISCKTQIERCRLLQASDNPDIRNHGQDLERASKGSRRELLKGLVNIGLYLPAIKLGEKYNDMEALAEVLESEIQTSQDDLTNNVLAGEETDEIRAKIALCEGFADKYFDKYGASWANAFFARFVAQGRVSQLLMHGPKHRRHMTSFFRSHPECAAFSWIHEVAVEGDLATAADDLWRAQKQADTVWAKKIQLSMSKLATVAAVTSQQKDDNDASSMAHEIDSQLEVLDAQEQLYRYLKPTMRRALNDTPAKVDVVMEQYFKRFVKAKKALRSAMKINVKKMVEEAVLDAEDLVDTISLMDEDGLDPASEFAVRRFLIAIRLVRLCKFETGEVARKDLLEKSIWRRCIIQDNWPMINRTEMKDDAQVEVETGATALFKTLKEGFKSGFWDDHPPPEPSALLNTGTTVESLRTSSRYDVASNSALEIIARDLEIEDSVLETCIKEGRLEQWWNGIVDAARISARNEANQSGEAQSRRQEAEREFQHQMVRDDQAAWGVQHADGAASGVDDEGDVMMGM
ncbi:MAG: hypothetical protein Q9208_002988 [Pyrenodesmia sp. 3 TL-2023]